jgi:glycosyltransferase involved in cell wall biosynthesis
MIKCYPSAHVPPLPRSIWINATNQIIPVLVMQPNDNKIICLSNIYDGNYLHLRKESVEPALTTGKRKDLFACLEMAIGREVVVLSSPPKASVRRRPRWLPPVETKFSTHRQLFCANWDTPKLRVPLSWFFYARHVLRHVRSGDLVVIDNYEFIYIVAAWFLRVFRRVTFVLDYEDGKHLSDRSWCRVLSGLAETGGRPLLRGAMLAHPALGKRLPASLPTELVPGFVLRRPKAIPSPPGTVRFVYSGHLDHIRGVDMLLEALPHLPARGWHLDFTGAGPLASRVAQLAQDPQWKDRIAFHQYLPGGAYEELLAACQVGLNCQRPSDPISEVTFPSKVFSYLSTGLVVLSSPASEMKRICGNACFYYDEETPQSLAAAMTEVIEHFSAVRQKLDLDAASDRYSVEATAARLRRLLQAIEVVK